MTGPLIALLSALLFGLATPVAKLLVGTTAPGMLAGLFYLGAGLGLALLRLLRQAAGIRSSEAPLRRVDLPWLGLVTLTGGIAAPLLLMVGLRTTPGSTAALLLNLEGLATMSIAWLILRENTDRQILAGAALILAGGLVLGWQGPASGIGWGAIAIVAACLAWGIDNTLTRRIAAADPVDIALVKGLVAGTVNTAIALGQGASLPAPIVITAALATGALSYGASLVLYVRALRMLGAARNAAYFSLAPFIGAALSIPLLGEAVTPALGVAGGLMAGGVLLHLRERHEHRHGHKPGEHSHAHVHDAHHRHAHSPGEPDQAVHSHPHRHDGLMHSHPHYPDLHHHHDHRQPEE